VISFAPIETPPWRVVPVAGGVRVHVVDADVPALRGSDAEAWDEAQRANSNLFDGPILSLVGIEATSALCHLTVQRDRYARFALQPAIHFGVRLFSVTALVIRPDARGQTGVLCLRRGERVHSYPDLWEFGPSGGVACPEAGVMEISAADLRASVAAEIQEECGLAVPDSCMRGPVALLHDAAALSTDVVMTVSLAAGQIDDPVLHLNWENAGARWIALGDLANIRDQELRTFAPPTVALIRSMIA